jgi:hypothetical protein
MEHKSNCDSYDDEVEDISVDESSTDTSMSEVEITDSDSSVDIQAQQWVEVRTSCLINNIKHLKQNLR